MNRKRIKNLKKDALKRNFRARCIAHLGDECLDYRHARAYLPKEAALYAQARDSDDTYYQHRCKCGLDLESLDSLDIEVLASLIGVTTSRWRKFLNDTTASEHLGGGTMHWFRRAFGCFKVPPGNDVVADAAIIRGPTVHLRWKITGKRPVKADLISIKTATIFEVILRTPDIDALFKEMLENYARPIDVPDSLRARLVKRASEEANKCLDDVDAEVFGTVSSHVPSVFQTIVEFWDAYGVEYIVVRDAVKDCLSEQNPFELLPSSPYTGTRVSG